MIAAETLEKRRSRLKGRLDRIRSEQKFRVWRGDEKEPTKLARAIAKVDRRQAREEAILARRRI